MRRKTNGWYFLFYLAAACTASTRPPAGPSTPVPSLPNPVPVPPTAGSWTFSYAPGAISYQISRSAAIESQSDSGSHREISTNSTHELVMLESIGDTIHFTAVIDTFSTATQGSIGPAQPVQLPIHFSGIFTGDSLIPSADSTNEKCNPISSALSADLHNLLIRFPAQLSRGTSWRDSVDVKACQGMIPTTVHMSRSYLVTAESVYQGNPALLVQRTDSVQARGEGAQQQHSVILDAKGTGSATYYVSPKDGRIARLTTGQDLELAITVSGKIHHFKQSSKQDYSLAR
jgi:hypothetical protein